MLKSEIDEDRLDETFAALANSTRRAILAHLAHGEASVGDLAEPFDLTLPAISKHIKVLEKAGLITRGRRAQFRPCTIAPDALAEVADWTEQYRHIWDDRFDRLDGYLQAIQDAATTTTSNTTTSNTTTSNTTTSNTTTSKREKKDQN